MPYNVFENLQTTRRSIGRLVVSIIHQIILVFICTDTDISTRTNRFFGEITALLKRYLRVLIPYLSTTDPSHFSAMSLFNYYDVHVMTSSVSSFHLLTLRASISSDLSRIPY
jgi:hypothetical protein